MASDAWANNPPRRRNAMMTMSVRVSGDVRPSKALHLGLWVVQGLLGALFLAVGAMKATQPIAVLVDTLGGRRRFRRRSCASSASPSSSAGSA
jgi:hypothetical protein